MCLSFFKRIDAFFPDVPGSFKIGFAHAQRNGILHLAYDVKEFSDPGGLDPYDLII